MLMQAHLLGPCVGIVVLGFGLGCQSSLFLPPHFFALGLCLTQRQGQVTIQLLTNRTSNSFKAASFCLLTSSHLACVDTAQVHAILTFIRPLLTSLHSACVNKHTQLQILCKRVKFCGSFLSSHLACVRHTCIDTDKNQHLFSTLIALCLHTCSGTDLYLFSISSKGLHAKLPCLDRTQRLNTEASAHLRVRK